MRCGAGKASSEESGERLELHRSMLMELERQPWTYLQYPLRRRYSNKIKNTRQAVEAVRTLHFIYLRVRAGCLRFCETSLLINRTGRAER